MHRELGPDLEAQCQDRPVRHQHAGPFRRLAAQDGKAGSHAGRGWDALTDACVAAVAARAEPSVFILWGAHAQAKAARIAALQGDTRHLVIRSPHPSPLSAYRGFFGSRPFSQTNAFLAAHGRGTIDWRVAPPDAAESA